MKLGIFAKTFAGAVPDQVLKQVAEAGFPTTQYNMSCSGLASMPDVIDPEHASDIARASARYGVEIAAVSGTYNMIHPDPLVRDRGHKRLRVLAAACAGIGTKLITLCTGTRDAEDQWRYHPGNEEPDAWRDLLDGMQIAIEIAEAYDVELGIEPELANVVSSARLAKQLIAEVRSERIRIVLDPANLFEAESPLRQREIVNAAIDLLADRIVMGHAKDRSADGRFTTAGEGVLDYPNYIHQLRAIGFDGALIAHGLSPSEAPAVAAFLGRVVEEAGA